MNNEIIELKDQDDYQRWMETLRTWFVFQSIMWRGLLMMLVIVGGITLFLFNLFNVDNNTILNLYLTLHTTFSVVLLVYALGLFSTHRSFTTRLLKPFIYLIKKYISSVYQFQYKSDKIKFDGITPTVNEQLFIWFNIFFSFGPLLIIF